MSSSLTALLRPPHCWRNSRVVHLPKEIEILPDVSVAELTERFEIFEALHRGMEICNPLQSGELDDVIDALAPADGHNVVDAACGYGELLRRIALRSAVDGVGIDLSPWMIATAWRRLGPSAPRFRWILGDAKNFVPNRPVHLATCLGAEWIWHDFGGTARALCALVERGGRVAIGSPRLHLDAPDMASRPGGRIETIDDQAASLASRGLTPLTRIDADDVGWDLYMDRTESAVTDWASENPGERANRYVEEQREWRATRERTRELMGWSVWIAQKL